MSKGQWYPDAKHRFFACDPSNDEWSFHATPEERDAEAEGMIETHLDEGWDEEVEQVFCGYVTHTACKVDIVRRGDPGTDDTYFPEGCDETCNYECMALPEAGGEGNGND